jgi:hypothetical protein
MLRTPLIGVIEDEVTVQIYVGYDVWFVDDNHDTQTAKVSVYMWKHSGTLNK